MAQHDQLYRRALYYDIALERDVSAEATFIQGICQRYRGVALRAVVDIACGPGYHARELARRGIRVYGLDLFVPMVELARERSLNERLDVRWVVADMREFALEDPVDMAVCMFDGIDALLTPEDFLLHLKSVAANLAPDGLYLIDCTHPRDCSYEHYGEYRYQGSRDGISVEIVWSTNHPKIDPVTGIAEVALEIHVEEGGRRETIRDLARERCLTAPELTLLARLSGQFEPVGWYGDYRLDQSLDHSPASHRMLCVLKKTRDR